MVVPQCHFQLQIDILEVAYESLEERVDAETKRRLVGHSECRSRGGRLNRRSRRTRRGILVEVKLVRCQT